MNENRVACKEWKLIQFEKEAVSVGLPKLGKQKLDQSKKPLCNLLIFTDYQKYQFWF